MFDYLIIVITA